MRRIAPLILALALAAVPARAQTSDVMVVFDMSGSMWGQVDGVAKVEIAREAFGGLLDDWRGAGTRAGLIAYGHRRKGDCGDIELMAAPGAGADLGALVAPLSPRGKTPLSDAVRQAADVLRFTEEAATVVLLSDGVETCEADPCALGAELEALGVDFTAHVIGFDIAEADRTSLACLAEETGGRYFDAADAGALGEAMAGVAAATAEPAVEGRATRPVELRLLRAPGAARPEEVIVFADGAEIGRVPGAGQDLILDLADGPVAITAEGGGLSGRLDLTVGPDLTGPQDLTLAAPAVGYAAWPNGPYPTDTPQNIGIVDRDGVDKDRNHRTLLVPRGAGPEAAVGRGQIGPQAGVWNYTRLSAPAAPGEYDILMVFDANTTFGRVPVTYADDVTPAWRGDREVAPGGRLRAEWSGTTVYGSRFRLVHRDTEAAATIPVTSTFGPDGVFLTVPNAPGLYDLTLEWRTGAEWNAAPLGPIAVGVPLPDPGTPVTAPEDAASVAPPVTPVTSAEADAMGGEEGPLLPVGELHGDWRVVSVGPARTIDLVDAQVVHEAGVPAGEGGSVVRAHESWGLGAEGSFGTMRLETLGPEVRRLTLTSDAGTATGTLTATSEGAWTGLLDVVPDGSDAPLQVTLLRPGDAVAAPPVDHQLIAVDERGERLPGPVTWEIESIGAQDHDTLTSDGGILDDFGRPVGPYLVRAFANELAGSFSLLLGPGLRTANFVVLAPDGEGKDLPLDATFYCASEAEDCHMRMADVDVEFELPPGWGAERPLLSDHGEVTFNMATLTSDGPFWVTLNMPQRTADLGPCRTVVWGTLCHDHTDDPGLLAHIDLIATSLSTRPAGKRLFGDARRDAIDALLGDTR